jgi:GTP-binding protein HflX
MSASEVSASLDELARLAVTLGLEPMVRLTQRRPGTGSPALVGAGKLGELARLTGGSGVVPAGASRRQKGARPAAEAAIAEAETEAREDDGETAADPAAGGERATVVLVDHDLTPSQLRNLEAATSADVLDRSSVILAIFQRHAATREARLQVEIARLTYLAPRLRETGGATERQRGGVGGKGAGESSLELDRRRVRDRIAELKQELALVETEARTRRIRRSQKDTVALVGYTNSGKSSLMRALTGSPVLVADQLFATLDTTVRPLHPRSRPPLLVSDTVGFIKRLPHDLVASFRSTLEEAREAALLVHVIDAADPSWREQAEVTRAVLGEIGAGDRPTLVVLNKADRLDAAARAELAGELPGALVLSALDPSDVDRLRCRIVEFFEAEMIEEELFVTYRAPRLLHVIHESCRVIGEHHEETGTRLRVRADRHFVDRMRAALAAEAEAAC